MKGIILAGGAGSRLYPMTKVMTKQLQPVYDKPMIYYPLSFLMLEGIQDILLITTQQDLPHFESLLGNGSQLGIKISYKVQDNPNGLPEAFILGEKFLAEDDVCLILGDNLFYGDFNFFRQAKLNFKKAGATIFAYSVSDPKAYGVVEFDKNSKKVISIEEKPEKPKSSYAIPGLYLFDSSVSERSKKLEKSPRGELEIVDLIKTYLPDNLKVEIIPRGIAWLDTGTPRSLLDASAFIGAIEERQGLKVACLEEVAFRMGFITTQEFESIIQKLPKNSQYRAYLEKLLLIK
jgi:glucose-1-phosphate thymidylyltransferase